MKLTGSLISEQLRQLPTNPGVYLMKDVQGNILYVGKAANLQHRVRSYFSAPKRLSPKIKRMVSRINDLDFFITTSEQEALILELNLIKRHRPRYNVRLKDGKTFPYLKINTNEDWPRVYVTRQLEEDGGRYFGPFASARSVRQTLNVIKRLFPFRPCSKPITGTDSRACLEYDIHNCLAPCIGSISREEYAEVIKQVILFLEGKQEAVVKELKKQMRQAAEALEFEKAALLRDQIQGVKDIIEGQRIAARVRGEQDVIAFADIKDQAYAQVFFIRGGKLIGRESFVLEGTRFETPEQIMTSFVKQFYGATPHIPPLILLQYPVEDAVIIESWLQSKRGAKVRIQVPRRGVKKQLVNIVAENAQQGLGQLKIKQIAAPASLASALAELQRELRLTGLPIRMEGYDISNIQGMAQAVGSMVVFENGNPNPSQYRRFKIKTVLGTNDYAMLQEVLQRRFKRSSLEGSDASWAVLPDLVLIDGGKGQLNAALSVMHQAGVESIPTASLAKKNEEIFIPQQTEPIVLPHSSSALQLLQRLRDEAHRFALSYYHKVHKSQTFASALDAIPGIGPKRKHTLLNQFGSVQAIQQASVEELASITNITDSLARKIKDYL